MKDHLILHTFACDRCREKQEDYEKQSLAGTHKSINHPHLAPCLQVFHLLVLGQPTKRSRHTHACRSCATQIAEHRMLASLPSTQCYRLCYIFQAEKSEKHASADPDATQPLTVCLGKLARLLVDLLCKLSCGGQHHTNGSSTLVELSLVHDVHLNNTGCKRIHLM